MAISFWDFMQVAAPVAASAIGTPAAGIAVGAAMQGAKSKAEGGSWEDALKSAALGAGTGALGGAAAGAIGKSAGAAINPELISTGVEAGADQVLKQGTQYTFGDILGKNLQGVSGSVYDSVAQEAASAVPPEFFENLTQMGNYAELGTGLKDMVAEFRGGTQQMLGPAPQQGPAVAGSGPFQRFQWAGQKKRPLY